MTPEEKLIFVVKKHPELYDKEHESYKDMELKISLWKSIGEEFGVSAKDAKKKWKGLRDTYTRRKNSNYRVDGSGDKETRPWRYESIMGFLDDHISSRNKIIQSAKYNEEKHQYEQYDSNDELSVKSSTSPSSNDQTPSPRANKRPYKSMYRTTEEEERRCVMKDPDEMYLLSLKPSLLRLSNEIKSLTKIKLLQILHDAEFHSDEKCTPDQISGHTNTLTPSTEETEQLHD